MRFLLYDKVTVIDKHKSIIGTKTFSLSDECLRQHYSRNPVVPGAMLIEAMAQLLGWLIIYSHDFQLSTFMSLIEKVDLPARLRPGFEAEIKGEIVSSSERDTLGTAKMFIGGRQVAGIGRIIYSHARRAEPEKLMQLFRYYSGMDVSPGRMTNEGRRETALGR
jgi:3-hydroxyacyl-[acyl-carrier-protein] dehydratase